VLFMLPFAAAMVLLAARIWQAAARPASHHLVLSAGPAEVPSAGQEETDEIREVPSRYSGQPANESGYTATAAEHPRKETAPDGR
jgi:hypothetical protein